MKKLSIFLILFIIVSCSSSDKILQLENKVIQLEKRLDSTAIFIQKLDNSNADLSNQLLSLMKAIQQTESKVTSSNNINEDKLLKNNVLERKQCQAITKAGTQCKRMAEPGSDYCWQHQNYNSTKSNISSPSSQKIYTGPRGGQYYYNSKGKKVYIKKK